MTSAQQTAIETISLNLAKLEAMLILKGAEHVRALATAGPGPFVQAGFLLKEPCSQAGPSSAHGPLADEPFARERITKMTGGEN